MTKPLDEIQKSVNNIIKAMVDFGDNSLLLRTQHLKLLSEKSGLAIEDLQAKLTKDLSREVNVPIEKQSFVRKPYKPSNTIGLPSDFLESNDEKKPETIARSEVDGLIEDYLTEQKSERKKLIEAYDYLIIVFINSPNQLSKFSQELTISSEFNLIEQELIIKALLLLLTKQETINEDSVLNLLKSKNKGDDRLSKNYERAYKYLKDQLSNPLYCNYFKGKLSKKNDLRITETVIKVQRSKYNLTYIAKMLKIYELHKQDPDSNKILIDQLYKQIHEIHGVYQEWKRNINKSL